MCEGSFAAGPDIICAEHDLLGAPCGDEAVPKKLGNTIRKKVKRAQRFLKKAEKAAGSGNDKKVKKFRDKAARQLQAIPKKTASAVKSRKAKKRISRSCKDVIDALVANRQQVIGEFAF